MLKLVLGVAVVLIWGLVLAMIFGREDFSERSRQADQARHEACARALMSNVGHSTVGYADKVAYEGEVADKCKGVAPNVK